MNKLIILALVALVGCGKKEEQVTSVPQPLSITYEQAADAILRAHPKSLQVCYDSKTSGFLLDYGPPYEDASLARNDSSRGWYWLKTPDLFLMANGTYFMQDLTPDKYVVVYPDVTNLPCKQH